MLKISTVVALALMVLVLGFLLVAPRNQKKTKSPPDFKTTTDFIQWMANEAVEDAEENNQVKLDYTPNSIQRVEEILGGLHDQYVKNPSSVRPDALGSAYGAYIGEVIRRTETQVRWERDDPSTGEKSYPLIWRTQQSYPMAWCYRRIVNGSEDDVWFKYRVLKAENDKNKATGMN
ncbi:MAG TPA: hypothetical protein VGF19_14425 [Candidatus Acidoferrum sp.]